MRPAVSLGVLAWAVVMLVAATPAQSASLPGNQFAVTQHTLYMTGQTGSSGDNDGVLLLDDEIGPQGSVQFLLPGVGVLGLVDQPSTSAWRSQTAWDKDLEIVDDAWAILYFQANAQALNSIFTVRLYDVAPDGQADLVDVDEKQFVTALDATAIEFPLSTAGLVVHKDHTLRLEVTAQTANALVLLQYGGDTPSRLDGLKTRWLDSDGDGVPDSDESALGRNPLNANDPSLDGKDTDGDGISDALETRIGTDPKKADTDGDGFGDGLEVHAGTDPKNALSKPYDVNGNGIPDNIETNTYSNVTNIQAGPDCRMPSCVDPGGDYDDDGCTNLCEAMHGTDPTNADTDGDGISDGDELLDGTSPTSALSVLGGVRGVPEPVAAAAAFAIGSTLVLLPFLRRT